MKISIFSQKEEFISSVSCLKNLAILFLDQGGSYAAYSNVPAMFLPGLLFPRSLYQIIPNQVSLLCTCSRDVLKLQKKKNTILHN